MRKIFFFCVAVLSMAVQAETYTLDLSTATDMDSKPIRFETKDIFVYNGNLRDVWDSTYSENSMAQLIYCNDAKFMFSHLPGGNSWNGTSWDGFTVSKNAADTLNQFACVAKGGLKGTGTPFAIGYYSDYTTTSLAMPNTMVTFSDEYYPAEVYICQSAWVSEAITKGSGMARAFTDNDTLALIISGLDGTYATTKSVTCYLAVDGKHNTGWTRVDLSSIGKCFGLGFTMTSTDKGKYGINTPTYFAMDGLKISTQEVAAGIDDTSAHSSDIQKIIVNGELLIIRDGIRYTMQGQRVE